MVISVDKVTEIVAVHPRPSYQESSVYSELEVSDHRRHREEINFRPVLHPVRYADTHYLYINSTRKRFVSRTFYEARVRPRSFSETTFTYPKSADQRFVAYLDFHCDENRKWFKTCLEIKGRKFTSAQILRSPNNNYINTGTTTTTTVSDSYRPFPGTPNGLLSDDDVGGSRGQRSRVTSSGHQSRELYDPGASQVFIPKKRKEPFSHQALVDGELILDFGNSKVEYGLNGTLDDTSDTEV